MEMQIITLRGEARRLGVDPSLVSRALKADGIVNGEDISSRAIYDAETGYCRGFLLPGETSLVGMVTDGGDGDYLNGHVDPDDRHRPDDQHHVDDQHHDLKGIVSEADALYLTHNNKLSEVQSDRSHPLCPGLVDRLRGRYTS